METEYTEADVLQELKNRIGLGKGQIKQKALAEEFGISRGYLNEIINGKKSVLNVADKLGFEVTKTVVVKITKKEIK